MQKFTFLLPAYKGKFLKEMLHSIQDQTYTDYKVIISDDCSPEDLLSICKPFLEDKRFTYRRNKINMGKADLVSHWNLLVDLCDTEYMILASDDDVYNIHFLEEINRLACKYPNVGIIRAKINQVDVNGNLLTYENSWKEYVTQLEFAAQMHDNRFYFCVANLVFKTHYLKKNQGFISFPLAWFSDNATMLQMAFNGCVNTSTELFYYRDSNDTISNSKNRSQSIAKIDAAISYHNWLKLSLKKYDQTGDSYKQFLYDFIMLHHQERTKVILYNNLSDCSLLNILNLYHKINKAGLGTKIGLIKAIFRIG